MQPIPGKEKQEQPSNYFYGVDVTNRKAVDKEFNRLRNKHRTITFFALIVIAVLALFIMDFIRVNYLEAKPILALHKQVDNGTLYSGIGYQALYCEDGERYVGATVYDSCSDVDSSSIEGVIYEKLVKYATDKGILDYSKLSSFQITSVTFDEDNDNEGSDYYVVASVSCKTTNKRCFDLSRDYSSNNNYHFYVRFDRYMEIYEVTSFKTSGEQYNKLVSDYSEKVKEYLIDKGYYDESRVKNYSVSLVKSYGSYLFRGVTYSEAYMIQIDYFCTDNSATCIKISDDADLEGDYSNYTVFMSLFIKDDDGVGLVGPKEYFDL